MALTGPPTGLPSLRTRRQQVRRNLQDQVLEAAATIIESEGADALSMRKLALAVDCAPMTLYSYFSDKHELLLELARRRFNNLAARLTGDPAHVPLVALRGFFLAYVRFGFESPTDYRTMFMTAEAHPGQERKKPDQMLSENPAFAAGFDRVRACVEAGLLPGDPHAITTLLWTAVHGAIAAVLTFPAFPFGDPESYAVRVLDLTIAALKACPNEPLLQSGSAVNKRRS